MITYLTMDSVAEGVGASQVWPYVTRLAQRGENVRLLSFEHDPSAALGAASVPQGVEWIPRAFRSGSLAPFRRIAVAAGEARRHRTGILHARSDLPALAAVLGRHPRWIWDMRAFWREQRIVLGDITPDSPTDQVLRRVEEAAADRASVIICLARAAIPVLRSRFGDEAAEKVVVIPTAVDTERFQPGDRHGTTAPTVLLTGTYNRFYDGPAMAKLLLALRRRGRLRAVWVGADERSPWWDMLRPELDEVHPPVPFDQVPEVVSGSDIGLAICRMDVGPSLLAAMPTKIAEFLACGRPVVVNAGLGDMDDLIDRYRCGVVLRDRSVAGIEACADEALDLLGDRAVPDRARACAEEVFDLEDAVARLAGVYESLR